MCNDLEGSSPSECLREYIYQYRLRHFVFQKELIAPVKPFPPRPEQCVTFFVRGVEKSKYFSNGTEVIKPRSVVSGQFTHRVDRLVSVPEILMIIVDFRPGALHRLTGIPFRELTNKDIDAEAIFPDEIKRVNDRLSSLNSYEEMIRVLECFFIYLIGRSKTCLPLHRLFTAVVKEPDRSVDWLASNAYLSTRQLERKFDERIGISPKTYLRICRFNRSYWMHLKNPQLTWFAIAMKCG